MAIVALAVIVVSILAFEKWRSSHALDVRPSGYGIDDLEAIDDAGTFDAAEEAGRNSFLADVRLQANEPTAGTEGDRTAQIVKHLSAMRGCYKLSSLRGDARADLLIKQHGCIEADEDVSRAYEYDDRVSMRMVEDLKQLVAIARSENERGGVQTFDLASLARGFVDHPSDDIKEEALNLASLLPDGREKLQLAIQALNATVSGPLADQAIDLIQTSASYDSRVVDQTLRAVLAHGGWDVKDETARKILPFLTKENRQEVEKLLAEAHPRSKFALYLRLNLEEFDRLQRL